MPTTRSQKLAQVEARILELNQLLAQKDKRERELQSKLQTESERSHRLEEQLKEEQSRRSAAEQNLDQEREAAQHYELKTMEYMGRYFQSQRVMGSLQKKLQEMRDKPCTCEEKTSDRGVKGRGTDVAANSAAAAAAGEGEVEEAKLTETLHKRKRSTISSRESKGDSFTTREGDRDKEGDNEGQHGDNGDDMSDHACDGTSGSKKRQKISDEEDEPRGWLEEILRAPGGPAAAKSAGLRRRMYY